MSSGDAPMSTIAAIKTKAMNTVLFTDASLDEYTNDDITVYESCPDF